MDTMQRQGLTLKRLCNWSASRPGQDTGYRSRFLRAVGLNLTKIKPYISLMFPRGLKVKIGFEGLSAVVQWLVRHIVSTRTGTCNGRPHKRWHPSTL